ncbi:34-kDa subunit of RNA polymerase III (C), variant 4 [Entomophthora muscae]|uniref:34-kDa subunit of RNA polymerase III (C), variant 4 n=3 Tax=Entomophthora muscae TaxID=34485 RepID=A0ACC2SF89_9FUNG|nr:34-kDa subunit of RNA polymerase III (C), variant 4 [Entomophthora muscae]
MASSLGLELELSDDQIHILKLSYLSNNGLEPKQALAELSHLDLLGIQNCINDLLSKGLIRAFQMDNTMLFKGVPKDEFAKVSKMTAEEYIVYQLIEESANQGIWIKTIKMKTGLHDTTVDKCIKSLVLKNLIKQISSVKSATQKRYMLFDLQASEEITGGPWYHDNKVDEQFVKLLYDNCFKIIARRSFPLDSKTATGTDSCYGTSHVEYSSASYVHSVITRMQLSNEKLTVEDITAILNLLVYDGKAVQLVGGKVYHPRRIKSDEDFNDEYTLYKAVTSSLEDDGSFTLDPLMEIPCSGCGVRIVYF